jgi:hypothetical protein
MRIIPKRNIQRMKVVKEAMDLAEKAAAESQESDKAEL